jgi:hypothetical protein
MLRKLTAGAFAALIALSPCAAVQAQPAQDPQQAQDAQQADPHRAPRQEAPPQQAPADPAVLEQQSRQAYADGEYLSFYIANLKLHNMFPYVPQYMINLVRASALLGKANTAYHYMHTMQQQGLSFDFNSTDDTENIRTTQAYDYMNNLMVDAGTPAGEGKVVVTLPGPPQDYGAMAWDPGRERLLVGTLREGKVLAVADDGNSEVLLEAGNANGLWSITGLAVDSKHERLWISSTASPAFDGYSPADQNRAALFEFDLGTLEPLGHSFVPVDALKHSLGSVAVTGEGDVYIVDTATPFIYRKVPGENRLEAFVASSQLVGLTDLAVTPDNSRLFASDPVKGIFVVDPQAKQATMMGAPENLNLAGIEGIEYANGQLFIVQGGIRPQRLMRLSLDAAGLAVEEIAPMAVALEAFDWPRQAAIRGGELYYFANQGAGADDQGAIVMRTSLDAGTTIQPPNLDQLERALKSQTP